MQLIFCELQLGDKEQNIYLVKPGDTTKMASATIDQLPTVITGIATANNVSKVVLRGVHDYAVKVMSELVNNGLTVEIQ